MRHKGMIGVLLFGMVLLGGCGNQAGEERPPEVSFRSEDTLQEEPAQENTVSDTDKETPETKDNVAVIKMGPDEKIWQKGSIVCTLHDFQLYESPQEASIDQGDINMVDAEDYADRSKFLLMQADINNIDYEGDYEDGSINLSMFTIGPKEQENAMAMEWGGSLPVYLSESGEGSDYYHVLIKTGDIKTVTIGFYVPVENMDELCSRCSISISGSYDDGYLIDIPEIS